MTYVPPADQTNGLTYTTAQRLKPLTWRKALALDLALLTLPILAALLITQIIR